MMSTTRTIHSAPAVSPTAPLRSLGGLLRALAATLVRWQQRAEDRGRLAAMEPRLLRDMGLRSEDARCEAAKPFWRH